ncbi:hypothetical protein HUN58_14690 [Curtobacterium sp. Csp1]|uniref:hypothetical protein n=1 Tax=Curtobacterium sp. Csp1 TaxID=2495429 RepID=UPI001597A912|nr:hypothetical protein [Curtobacterium sp. Csp1]QKS21001.1 hypothetical protein HUN58_14690 [Curtobacterium sp. Csp1]
MAADDHGPKGNGIYSAAGGSDDGADLTEIAAYAATVGNRKVGSTAQRNAAVTEENGTWEGLIWGDTTDGNEYRFTSGSWAVLFPQVRDTKYASRGIVGLGPNETTVLASTTVTIPNGRTATLRCSGVTSMGKNASDGAFAGSLTLTVGGAAQPGPVAFHSQQAAAYIPFTPGAAWNVPVVGTGQPLTVALQIRANSTSAPGAIYSTGLLVSAEY